MFISPYICSNVSEFADERALLREHVFPYLKEKLNLSHITFSPTLIDYTDADTYFKSGHLLRLLLTNIHLSQPFFVGLVGFKYGLNENQARSIGLLNDNNIFPGKSLTAVEKNLLNASQTGFSHLVNSQTFTNSFLEHQVNLACASGYDTSLYRFYFRQYEFLEEKFSHLTIQERKDAIRGMEAEDEWAKTRLDDLKMRLIKQGVTIRYYKSLEQLTQLVLSDFDETIRAYMKSFRLDKPFNTLVMDDFVLQKMRGYVETSGTREMRRRVEQFLKQKPSHGVHFKFDTQSTSASTHLTSDNEEELNDTRQQQQQHRLLDDETTTVHDDSEEFLEILRLRHSNLSRAGSHSSSSKSNHRSNSTKKILLIVGDRGYGKTCLMASLYKSFVLEAGFTNNSNSSSNETTVSSSLRTNSISLNKPNQLVLFYFLKKGDYLIDMIIDITRKMRLRYLKKESSMSLDRELSDQYSLIQQFQASMRLGPVFLFVDGLSELDQNHSIPFDLWFPERRLDSSSAPADTRFILTVRRTSELYLSLTSPNSNNKTVSVCDMRAFLSDSDYHELVAPVFSFYSDEIRQFDPNLNCLVAKHLDLFASMKESNHIENPMYISLMAHEVFTFDKEIHRSHRIYQTGSGLQDDMTTFSDMSSSEMETLEKLLAAAATPTSQTGSVYSSSLNFVDNYIEEVATIGEIIEKMIKRYIKKNNWSVNRDIALSIENCGWVGDTLCFIALSPNGVTKDSIMRLLEIRGYTDKLEVSDLYWAIFRLQFSIFIREDGFGVLKFTHDYFREAVEAILLDGFSVITEFRPGPNLPISKKNITSHQRKLHVILAYDILKNRMRKHEFDFSARIDDNDSVQPSRAHLEDDDSASTMHLNKSQCERKYLKLTHELIYHLYMAYDLINLCKIITNFKIINLFSKNRILYLKEWLDFIKLIRLTTNPSLLRSILLSSFTIGIPSFKIDFTMNEDDLNDPVNIDVIRLETPTTSKNLSRIDESLADNNDNDNEGLTTFNRQISRDQDNVIPILLDNKNVEFSEDATVFSEVYENLVDGLLDMTSESSSLDLSALPNNDSLNLMLVSRCIQLVDLIAYLSDDRLFEKCMFPLSTKIFEIVNRNYPLNHTEKLKLSILLQLIGEMAMKSKDYKTALSFFLKSIETFEDVFETFHFAKVNSRIVDHKLQLLDIAFRLCFLYSHSALIMLKIDDFTSIDHLLTRASNYNGEKVCDAFRKLKAHDRLARITSKFDYELRESKDTKYLVYRNSIFSSSFVHMFNRCRFEASAPSDLFNNDDDDGGSYEANIYFYLISGLFEVKTQNYGNAFKFFQLALQMSLKWYGFYHSNTSQVYHHFGCFLALPDTEFYHGRRAELYLRKSLHIKHVQRKSKSVIKSRMASEFLKLKSLANTNDSSSNNNDESSHRRRAFTVNNDTDEIVIADILFDLGLLLVRFDSSPIMLNEALECFRRALDIKSLCFGPDHIECLKIDKYLNETLQTQITEPPSGLDRMLNSSCSSLLTQASGKLASRRMSARSSTAVSLASSGGLSREDRLRPTKSAGLMRKRNEGRELNEWIERNSIIQVIPISVKDASRSVRSLKTNLAASVETPITINQETTSKIKRSAVKSASDYSSRLKKAPSQRSVSFNSHVELASEADNIHSRETKSAMNVERRKLLWEPRDPNDSTLVKERILKHIYYKSAWYDIPPGSSKNRFRRYIKLAPNA